MLAVMERVRMVWGFPKTPSYKELLSCDLFEIPLHVMD
jgi:hypothetical protein